MIYSCFNEQAGHYEYFQDDRAHPMNGDLPIPDLQSKQAGQVGVPARDAGRPLPPGAQPAGVGWDARGMIVQCQSAQMRGLAGLGSDESPSFVFKVALVLAGAVAGGLIYHYVARGL